MELPLRVDRTQGPPAIHAGGPEKAPGVVGAVRAGWIDSLVTDLGCATRMLDLVADE